MGRLTRSSVVFLLLLAAACGGSDSKVSTFKGTVVAEVDSLDFGPVFIGDRGVVHVRVQNRSRVTGPLVVVIDGPFRVLPGETADLGPSQVQTVDMEYRPVDEKVATGSATFSISGVDTKAVVALTGTGSKRAVQAVPALDLGSADLGTSVTKNLDVTSLAKVPLVVTASVGGDQAFAFALGAQQLAIPANGTAKLPITFTPVTEEQHRTTLELRPCATGQVCDSFKVSLTGSGLKKDVRLSTTAVVFGDVPVGDTAHREVTLQNKGTVPAWVSAIVLQDGPGSPFAMTTDTAVPVLLQPNHQILMGIDFTPTTQTDATAVIVVEAGGKLLSLPLSGTGGTGDLLIDPPSLNFGVVPSGTPVTFQVTLTDVGTDTPVRITDIHIDNDPEGAFLDTFSVSLPTTVRTMPLTVDVTFNGPHEGTFDAELTIAPEVGSNRHVLLHGEAVAGTWCDLTVPAGVRFGMVTSGKQAKRTLVLRNNASTPCSVGDFHVTGSGAFRVDGLPGGRQTIAGKGTLSLDVSYAPTHTSIVTETATLDFVQTTQDGAARSVALSGLGTEADLTLTPASLDFKTQPTFSDTLLGVDILNSGPRPVQIVREELTAGVTDLSIASRSSASTVAPGVQSTVQLDFRPRTQATVSGELMIWLAGAVEPFIVPITGAGITQTCGTYCDEPVISCPAAQNGVLQRGFELVGAAKDARGQSVTCAWQVTAAPGGSLALPVADTDCSNPATFTADIPGNYTLQLTATDADTKSKTCTVDLKAPTYEGLWVETRWDQNDHVDLHLFLPEAGRVDRASTWRSGTMDCWEDNPRPAWGAPGLADDPVLEAAYGKGPEVVRVDSPVAGQKYELGVHWPTTAFGHTSLNVDTVIWCGGSQVASNAITFNAPYSAVDLGTIEITAGNTCSFTSNGGTITVLP